MTTRTEGPGAFKGTVAADGTAPAGGPSGALLSPDLIDALRGAGTPQTLQRGEVLVTEGSAADAFFIVLNGRFIVFHGARPIAEIAAGEPIGEIAFFAGGSRTATVTAGRAGQVLRITRDSYRALCDRVPGLPEAVIAALAERLRRSVPATASLKPRPGDVIGILPAGGGRLDPAFLAALGDELGRDGSVVTLSPDEVGAAMDGGLGARLAERGLAGRTVVLSCADPSAEPEAARRVFDTADTVLLVLDRRHGGAAPGPSALEAEIAATFLPQSVHLALLHAPGTTRLDGTAQALEGRAPGIHHHVGMDNAADIARLSRFLRGRAFGAVFGGGGAFGTAHLALVKALAEHGVTIDMVGGASVGAAMGGAVAMGLGPDEVLDRCDDIFVRSRAMKRLTVPKHSILDPRYFDDQLRRHYGEIAIEDLPIPYYAVSTSLTRNDLAVLRRGALWRAVRASSSIPAVFPPLVAPDGEVFIDGAYIDNVPVETMRGLKPGPNLVLSLEGKRDWRVMSDYDALPGRGRALAGALLGPLVKRVRFPGISSIMTRSMIVNSERRLANIDPGSDIFVPVSPLPGMGFLDWTRGRRLYEATYARASAALAAEADAGATGLDLLRRAAARLSAPEAAG
ncbi:patatin-like phospholipase family protein [Palleronia sp. KMU-117]|uniref:patatin-like phospholipase family protein n=1 Tax=Palleronia sp. KMU-117 TaxID=3434108 RepID=UPI003D723FC1